MKNIKKEKADYTIMYGKKKLEMFNGVLYVDGKLAKLKLKENKNKNLKIQLSKNNI